MSPLRSAAAGLQGFVVRADFLNDLGLQNMLVGTRKVGPETANLKKVKVNWIDYTSKRFRIDIFRPE